ncbi:hypothetical protein E4N62_45225 [Streptomyces sp. MNU76]|uniref:hypothetical protein n=1 Tax=Streptomyces sp. MNU76 TaxID=2560026 RepID=UPI001E52290A|nr:hypothetical protein [Streptomyces sp. MNU76]MCC9711790.1 hypothetical protein [Streptomyces sp. MNU76]
MPQTTTFSCADDVRPHEDEVLDVLKRLEPAGAGIGQWSEPPRHIAAKRLLQGGRDGPLVLEAEISWRTAVWRCVVKIGPAAEMRAEWRAYQDHLMSPRIALCAPVEAATRTVLDRDRSVPGRREAVVYGHVSHYAGGPDRSVVTLEERVAQVWQNGPEAVAPVLGLLAAYGEKACAAFYSHAEVRAEDTSLDSFVPDLGPMFELRVDGSPPDGDVAYCHERTLLKIVLAPTAPAGPVYLGSGSAAVDGPRTHDRIEYRLVPSPAVGTSGEIKLCGAVADRYPANRWSAISERCRDLVLEEEEVAAGGERTLSPFARLYPMLTDQRPGRVESLVHGDPNPRNLIVATSADGAEQIYLIDFARTRTGQPPLADFTWLELGLLRDVFAPRFDFGEVLALQRALFLAGALTDASTAPPRKAAAAAEQVALEVLRHFPNPLLAAFRVLWAVRTQAALSLRGNAARGWHREYAAHLCITANQTFGWNLTAVGPAAIAATVAAAGVCAESYDEERPYGYWPAGLLVAAARATARGAAPDGPRTAAALAALVDEMDHRGLYDPELEAMLREVGRELVRTAFREWGETTVGRATDPGPRLVMRAADTGGRVEDVQRHLDAGRLTLLRGEPQSGKTAVVEQWCLRQAAAAAAAAPESPSAPPELRVPLVVSATRLSELLPDRNGESPVSVSPPALAWTEAEMPPAWADHIDALRSLGILLLVVDGLDALDPGAERQRVVSWLLVHADAPRAGILVCERPRTIAALPAEPDLADVFDVLVLEPPDDEQIRRTLLGRLLADARLRDPVGTADRLFAMMFGEQSEPRLAAGLRSPRLVTLVADLAAETAAADGLTAESDLRLGIGEVLYIYARQKLTAYTLARSPRLSDPYDAAEALLAELARELTDRRATELPEAELAGGMPLRIENLTKSGLIERRVVDLQPVLAFTSTTMREFFAARWLYLTWSEDPDGTARRVCRPAWHEPARILQTFTVADEAPAEALVRAALEHDLLLAARLLAAAPAPNPAALDDFLTRADSLLRRPDADPVTRCEAASALGQLGGARARALLRTVAQDPSVDPGARTEAVRGLASIARRDRTGNPGALRAACAAVLGGASDNATKVAAVNAVARNGLTALTPRLAELVDPAQPWPVSSAARRALRTLDTDPTEALTRRWVTVCEERLTANVTELTAAAGYTEQLRLTDERCALLGELAAAGRVEPLLRHRFDFAAHDEAGRLLEQTTARWGLSPSAPERKSVPPLPAEAWEVLTGPPSSPEDLAHRFVRSDDRLVAAAAAHRLLALVPERAALLLTATAGELPPDRLPALAVAVGELDAGLGEPADQALDRAEQLVTSLVEGLAAQTAGDHAEALAGLVCAVFSADRARGVRLALRTARTLKQRGLTLRHNWPWIMAFARTRALPEDLETLLDAGGEDAALALFGLAGSSAFLLDASSGPGHRPCRTARERLAELWPGADDEDGAEQFVSAAATAGLAEAFPYACLLAATPGFGTTPRRRATGPYGFLEQTALADVLPAVGWLARLAAARGDAGALPRARDLLTAVAPTPDSALGRLAGLAYLGEWQTVIDDYEQPGPRASTIVTHAVRDWHLGRPGGTADDAIAVADHITRRLAGQDLPPEVRGTLRELKRACELRADAPTPPRRAEGAE